MMYDKCVCVYYIIYIILTTHTVIQQLTRPHQSMDYTKCRNLVGWIDTPVVSLVVRVHWFGFGGMEHRMNLTSHTTAAHFFDAPHKDTSTETT